MTSQESATTVSIIGPTHPDVGGIAQHTTRLAHELTERGLLAVVESWRAQYPRRARRGLGEVALERPELPLPPRVRRGLAWYSPLSWIRAGRRLRGAGLVLFTVVTPFHAIPFLVVRAAAGRAGLHGALVHNVVPHEGSPLDRLLMGALLRRMDLVLVHSREQAALAAGLRVRGDALAVAPLPPPGISTPSRRAPLPRLEGAEELRLLFFGMVRPYKGLDLLIRALPGAPGARLIVAGHFWEPVGRYRGLADRLGVADRVEFEPGYVEAQHISSLFARADVLVMPYRSASASIVPAMAFAHGRPVIATSVGSLREAVADGVTGAIVPPGDVDALTAAIRRLSERPALAALAAGVASAEHAPEEAWRRYVDAVAAPLGDARPGPAGGGA